jgi:hypothetical protein
MTRMIELQRRFLINHAVPYMIFQQRTILRVLPIAPRIRRRIRRIHHNGIDIEMATWFVVGRIVLVEIGGEESDLRREVEIGAQRVAQLIDGPGWFSLLCFVEEVLVGDDVLAV